MHEITGGLSITPGISFAKHHGFGAPDMGQASERKARQAVVPSVGSFL